MTEVGVETPALAPPALTGWGRGFRAVRIGLGILLIAAALAKVYGISVDPVARVGLFYSPSFQKLVVGYELLAGLWFVSGVWPIAGWLTGLATFGIFALFSGYAGWIGMASCGCLGAVHVSPWWAFAIDVAAIAALGWFRPATGAPLSLHRLKPALIGVSGISALLVALLFLGHFTFGSVPAALAWLRNEKVVITPDLLDVGSGLPSEFVQGTIDVANMDDEPIRVVGGSADCSCVALLDLPVIIPPKCSKTLTIEVHLPRSSGIFNRSAMLILEDNNRYRQVYFSLTADVLEPAPGEKN